ncbi:putative hydrolase [Halosimplex carlsbadense 2-9-1]|uniref:Putative hydrolase n=1 Tax=Halosimplex carlsbadense 2-9-1 TaxID=797114 RepID=M0D124_9EURY|nr:putative hydrolase [Halosimplex carlsbadense 2-9-1]
MGDQQDGVAGLVQLGEEIHDLRARLGVDVAGRLVGQQQCGVGRQRAGDGDALALAARQLRGAVVEAVAEADPREQVRGALAALAAVDALEDQRQRDVLDGGQPRHEVERLEDEADRPAAGPRALGVGQRRDVLAVDPDDSPGGRVEPADEVQERALARPAGAHDGRVRARGERQRDVRERLDGHGALVGLRHVREVDDRLAVAGRRVRPRGGVAPCHVRVSRVGHTRPRGPTEIKRWTFARWRRERVRRRRRRRDRRRSHRRGGDARDCPARWRPRSRPSRGDRPVPHRRRTPGPRRR